MLCPAPNGAYSTGGNPGSCGLRLRPCWRIANSVDVLDGSSGRSVALYR